MRRQPAPAVASGTGPSTTATGSPPATTRVGASSAAPSRRVDPERAVPRFPLRVPGLGVALPAASVSNDDLARHLDTSNAWIVGRTGIRARRVARAGETTTHLAATAAAAALRDARLRPSSVDLVVVATATPDSPMPSTAARVAASLGIRAGGFDLNGACTGFVHAFHTAAALLADPAVSTALVVGVDRMTSLVDPRDRSTAVLFGDGAGAAVLARAPGDRGGPGILGADIGGDGRGVTVLEVPPGRAHLAMDGPELFRRATRGLVASAAAALTRAGVGPEQVDLFVPHQANARIVGAAAERLGIPADRVVLDVAERANTSAASVPLALAQARSDGRIAPGARVLLSAIGAGLGWASLYLRWEP